MALRPSVRANSRYKPLVRTVEFVAHEGCRARGRGRGSGACARFPGRTRARVKPPPGRPVRNASPPPARRACPAATTFDRIVTQLSGSGPSGWSTVTGPVQPRLEDGQIDLADQPPLRRLLQPGSRWGRPSPAPPPRWSPGRAGTRDAPSAARDVPAPRRRGSTRGRSWTDGRRSGPAC